jgi:hypothetical protein
LSFAWKPKRTLATSVSKKPYHLGRKYLQLIMVVWKNQDYQKHK